MSELVMLGRTPTTRVIGGGSAMTMIKPPDNRAPEVVSVVYKQTNATITFDRAVINSTTIDWVATVNALPNAVISALIGPPNVVLVTWTTPGASTNAVIIDYTQGTLASQRGRLVADFQETGVIP